MKDKDEFFPAFLEAVKKKSWENLEKHNVSQEARAIVAQQIAAFITLCASWDNLVDGHIEITDAGPNGIKFEITDAGRAFQKFRAMGEDQLLDAANIDRGKPN